MVDRGFLLIEEFIGYGRFTCFKKIIDWEDREYFNGISGGMASELRRDPCMDKYGISYSMN
jgi:hypothetical protein